VVSQYKISDPISCEFWARGLNDTYKVSSDTENFALRIYRKNWRTQSNILFEIEAIKHLHKKGANVAYPIERNEGGYITNIVAPEGIRQVIVTKYADGIILKYEKPEDAATYGRETAHIHELSSDFDSKHHRYKLDFNHLVQEPMADIESYLCHRPNDWKFIKELASNLSKIFISVSSKELDYGFCHGDCHGYNAHEYNNEITHFDFDCCGFGFRVYDLATFKWSLRLQKKETEFWPKFLDGYKSVRKIPDIDLNLIESFVAVRDIWLMALHMGNTDYLAKGWIDETYIDKHMEFLREVDLKVNAEDSGS
jgi:Ser/Thr protein kinase RdoA (MazF antagonist)